MKVSASERPTIIETVKTPMSFFTLVALIIEVILTGATLSQSISILAPLSILGLLVVLVFALAWRKPYAFYPPEYWPRKVRVNLLFPIHPIQVALNVQNCVMGVREKEAANERTKTPRLTFGNGGWSCELSDEIQHSDSVRLELVEDNGRKWKVRPFAPYEKEVTAIQI